MRKGESLVMLRILHLEDEQLDSELALETLCSAGIAAHLDRVDTLADLTAALVRGGYSLVLSDYTIPGTDPLEALRLSRQMRPGMPFIFLSGTIGEERATQVLKLGASDYVLKQRMEQLPEVVRRAIGEAKEASRRRRAEEALRRSEERLRLSQEVAQLGSFEWHIESGKMEWSPEIETQHGLELGSFAGTLSAAIDAYVYLDDRDHVRKLFNDALTQDRFQGDWRIVLPDGSVRWLFVRGQRFLNESGATERVVGVSLDITDRKQTEAELRSAIATAQSARTAAEEATKAKDHFLAVLSHELRTPLTAVMPALNAMQSLVLPEGKDYLDMASRNVALEAMLIDDLLDMTRIERGKMELFCEPTDLCVVIKQAVDVCQSSITARGQHFAMQLNDAPHMVNGDPSRLQQVFWNLIQNAVKFTPPGGCLGIRLTKQDSRSIVEVQDSGAGIEPEAAARIFNPFEQEGKLMTRQFGGLGLGLAISKTITEMHGGSIRVSSRGKDKGSTFVVEIPLLPADFVMPAKPAPLPPKSLEVAHLRILLVEDHVDTARILSVVLRKAGHEVMHAGTVALGLQLAANEPFDLLLSDLGLPDASGLDLMRQLRERGSSLRGIALSGYAQAEDVQRSHEAGFAEHIAKPVSVERLLATVAQVSTRASEGVVKNPLAR